MSTGPIEFARSPIVDDKGPTEYGGDAGLIQKGPKNEHLGNLSTDERVGVLLRSGSSATDVVTVDEDGATTIVRTVHAEGIDPVTGLSLVDVASEEVTTDSVKPVL